MRPATLHDLHIALRINTKCSDGMKDAFIRGIEAAIEHNYGYSPDGWDAVRVTVLYRPDLPNQWLVKYGENPLCLIFRDTRDESVLRLYPNEKYFKTTI